MTIPIICFKCGSRGVIAKVTEMSACAACGCEDIDIDDFEPTTAIVQATAEALDEQGYGTTKPEFDAATIAKAVAQKLHEIAAGVLATNPSMTREAAYKVAEKTVTRYPKVAGVTEDAMAMLSRGFEAGLVEEDAVTWFAPTAAGQSIARERLGDSQA